MSSLRTWRCLVEGRWCCWPTWPPSPSTASPPTSASSAPPRKLSYRQYLCMSLWFFLPPERSIFNFLNVFMSIDLQKVINQASFESARGLARALISVWKKQIFLPVTVGILLVPLSTYHRASAVDLLVVLEICEPVHRVQMQLVSALFQNPFRIFQQTKCGVFFWSTDDLL